MTTTLDAFLEKPSPSDGLKCHECKDRGKCGGCIYEGQYQAALIAMKNGELSLDALQEDGSIVIPQEQRPLRKASRDNQAWELLAKLKGKSVAECQADQEKRLAKGVRK